MAEPDCTFNIEQPMTPLTPMSELKPGDCFRLENGQVPMVWIGRNAHDQKSYRAKYLNRTGDIGGKLKEFDRDERDTRKVVRIVICHLDCEEHP